MFDTNGSAATDDYRSDLGLSVALAVDGRHLVIALGGDVDVANADLLPAVVAGSLRGDPSVRIDLSEVTFLDSSLLRALLVCQANLHADGIDFKVRNPTEQARRVFEMTSLTALVE